MPTETSGNARLEALANGLLQVGLDTEEIAKLCMSIDLTKVSRNDALLGFSLWLDAMKVACAHGLAGVSTSALNTEVVPMVRSYLEVSGKAAPAEG
ncbi:hypothetical protein D3C86_1688800 [compost metagenome]